MFQNTDQFNQVLTSYAQGAYANPGEDLDISRLVFPEVAVDEATATGSSAAWQHRVTR